MLRHPGRLLAPGEFVPPAVVGFIGRQLNLDGDELADYAVRSETRHEHLAELRRLYGFRSFSGGAARELVERFRDEAEQVQSNEDLVRRFVEACRDTRTILPATTTIERLCADAGAPRCLPTPVLALHGANSPRGIHRRLDRRGTSPYQVLVHRGITGAPVGLPDSTRFAHVQSFPRAQGGILVDRGPGDGGIIVAGGSASGSPGLFRDSRQARRNR